MKTCAAIFVFSSPVLVALPAWAGSLSGFVAGANDAGGNGLWTILNSSFALWFLSSVVVAGLTFVYTRHQRIQGERTQRLGTQKRLNTEISSRIANALVALRLEQKRVTVSNEPYFASAMYTEAGLYLDNRFKDKDNNVVDFSIYPEKKHTRFRSLLYELTDVVEPSTLAALREAEAAYTKLETLADETPLQEDFNKPADRDKCMAAIADSCKLLEHLQRHSFWRARL